MLIRAITAIVRVRNSSRGRYAWPIAAASTKPEYTNAPSPRICTGLYAPDHPRAYVSTSVPTMTATGTRIT